MARKKNPYSVQIATSVSSLQLIQSPDAEVMITECGLCFRRLLISLGGSADYRLQARQPGHLLGSSELPLPPSCGGNAESPTAEGT